MSGLTLPTSRKRLERRLPGLGRTTPPPAPPRLQGGELVAPLTEWMRRDSVSTHPAWVQVTLPPCTGEGPGKGVEHRLPLQPLLHLPNISKGKPPAERGFEASLITKRHFGDKDLGGRVEWLKILGHARRLNSLWVAWSSGLSYEVVELRRRPAPQRVCRWPQSRFCTRPRCLWAGDPANPDRCRKGQSAGRSPRPAQRYREASR